MNATTDTRLHEKSTQLAELQEQYREKARK
jgi:hypothetical protein